MNTNLIPMMRRFYAIKILSFAVQIYDKLQRPGTEPLVLRNYGNIMDSMIASTPILHDVIETELPLQAIYSPDHAEHNAFVSHVDIKTLTEAIRLYDEDEELADFQELEHELHYALVHLFQSIEDSTLQSALKAAKEM